MHGQLGLALNTVAYYNLRMRQLFLLLVISLICLPVFTSAITVGPAKIEYSVDPGTVINDTLVILNEGSEQQTFYPAFEKFNEINGEKKFLPGEPTALTNWFKFPPEITLKSGEQKRIPFNIEIPKNAPAGGHFAVIWWGTAPPQSQQVAVVTRAGILVYLKVTGEVNEAGNLTLFTTENNRLFFLKLPENFLLRFKNIGNTYLKPQGEISIKNIFGGKIINFTVNEAGAIFLPDTENDLRIVKKFEQIPFALGLYKGELTLRWGEKPESIQKDIWLFIFPWKWVSSGLIIFLVLLFGVKKGFARYNRWIIKKYTNR